MYKLLRFHQNPILTNLYQNLEDVEHPEIESYLHEQVEVEENTTKISIQREGILASFLG
jgi:hypothetical protein